MELDRYERSWRAIPLRYFGRDRTSGSSADTLYAIESTRLLKSVNSGASWTQIGSSTITSPVNVVCTFTNTNIVLASVSGKLKLSTDGGSAWTDKNSNSALYHTSIEIAKANSALMFAGYEKILYTTQCTRVTTLVILGVTLLTFWRCKQM